MKRLGLLVALAVGACGNQTTTTLSANQLPRREPGHHRGADPTAGLDHAISEANTRARAQRPTRSRPPTARSIKPPRSGDAPTLAGRHVNSTAYCLTSRTADGGRGYVGSVAMNGVPFGSQWRILTGPLAGHVLEVNDRIGHSSSFDIWMPSCTAARSYGRRSIQIERVR